MTQKFRKKPVIIEAAQWFKNGDHPKDCLRNEIWMKDANWEGRVVRYFRHPDVPSKTPCNYCGKTMHEHGWVDTLEGGHIVCPGDWIIKGVAGEYYPCKPEVFEQTYEPVES